MPGAGVEQNPDGGPREVKIVVTNAYGSDTSAIDLNLIYTKGCP
jgi:hypothetical protein